MIWIVLPLVCPRCVSDFYYDSQGVLQCFLLDYIPVINLKQLQAVMSIDVISDVWVIWERISQKLIFWRRGWAWLGTVGHGWYSDGTAWVRSVDLGDYLGFLAGDFCHSTSVSPSGGFPFLFCSFYYGKVVLVIYDAFSSRFSATALDGEYVSTFFGHK